MKYIPQELILGIYKILNQHYLPHILKITSEMSFSGNYPETRLTTDFIIILSEENTPDILGENSLLVSFLKSFEGKFSESNLCSSGELSWTQVGNKAYISWIMR